MIKIKTVESHSDIETVANLAREIWTDHYTPIIGSDQVDYMLDKFQSADAIKQQLSGGYEYYLASEDGNALGYIGVIPNIDESSLMLSKIYVRKSARGKGVGQQFLDFCLQLCRDRKLKSIWLTVNKHNSNSINWYERMGFNNVAELVQDIGNGYVMDDYKMVKSLPEN